MDVKDTINRIKLVPVVVFNNVEETLPILNALKDGDVPVAEICFRTECAKECLKLACKSFGDDFLIGAGTVINEEQCREAIACGVKFIVSPGLSESVAKVCKEHNIPYFPGIATPTELMKALELGIDRVKFFPNNIYGGLPAINAIGAAFPQVKFMPTGGVSAVNLKEMLSSKRVFACGGSWMCKGTPEEITKLCLEARQIVKEL